MIYTVDIEGARSLLAFLLEDCCEGHPEVCLPLTESVERACGDAPRKRAVRGVQHG